MWRYPEALPIADGAHVVSFDEGWTPLLRIDLGRPVWVKQEQLFSTGSYKDRGASLLISKVRELGVREVVEDSSGNAGAAIAAYCARAGIACAIYVPAHTSPAKLAQIAAYGATLHPVAGSREDVAAAALEAARHSYYASHSWNPFFLHGTKTFAYEVCEQLGWRAPDAVVLPVGNGTLLLGAAIGFRELRESGIIDRMPRLIGVQAARCAPLARAFGGSEGMVEGVESAQTMAEGIAIAQPVRGTQILEAVRETGGLFCTVTEEEIGAALADMGRRGFYIEPTAAAAIAGVRKLRAELAAVATVVTAFTGHGLKAAGKLPA
jgi:threonine synthase